MSGSFQIGHPPIEVNYKHNPRAKRMTLRISNATGAVKMTLPGGVPVFKAQEFAKSKEVWLRKHLAKRGPERALTYGSTLLIDGEYRTITLGAKRAVTLDQDRILTTYPEDRLPHALAGYLKALARERFAQASGEYADALGLKFTKITMRDTTSRWGSCTTDGGLMFSWRLIMAPPHVQRYVAVHEVCHLRHMDHSKAFWDLVASIYPTYKTSEKWLKAHGSKLHQVRF